MYRYVPCRDSRLSRAVFCCMFGNACNTTHPDDQRAATKAAGRIAGINVLRIINEPTAAAVAYGLSSTGAGMAGGINCSNDGGGTSSTVLIFDLGGGTFDVSLLSIDDGGILEVRATAGDTHLGGQDFDTRLATFLVGEWDRQHGQAGSNSSSPLLSNPKAMRKLLTAAEKAKIALSTAVSTDVEIDALYDGEDFSGMSVL